MKEYLKYAQDTVSSENAGSLIKLSCSRFLNDLRREDLEFRENEVDRCINFIGLFKHYTGSHSGKQFKLEPWQQFLVANIIGFYWKGTNRRRFTNSYIEVARKQGKSQTAAALCLYFLIADKEDGAEVLLAANSKDQAKIAFEMCSVFAKQLDKTGKKLICYRADILFNATNSKLKCLAADDSKLDGFNASFGLIDEFHSAKNSKVRDVIKSSMGMRSRPHLCTITTAGFNKNSPCYELRTTCCEVLKGIKQDDSTFAAIYSLDVGDNWKNPEVWAKSNPNLGVTVFPEYLKEQVNLAINNPSEEVGVKTKNLNMWCDVSDVWINDISLVQNSKQLDLSIFRNRQVYIGVDLAATGDLTAVSYMTEIDNIKYFYVKYYLPSSCLDGKKNSYNYRNWKNSGNLTVTEGNVTDYDYITKDMLEVAKYAQICNVAYDNWNSTQWAIDAVSKGLPLNPYSQSIGNFNRPTKEFERLLYGRGIVIDSNPINRFCFKNVVLKTDHNGNSKPSKESYNNKIDGVIAMLMSLGGYLQTPKYNNQIFSV